jgi:RNA polymerase sigma factor (TIGR02999 family)
VAAISGAKAESAGPACAIEATKNAGLTARLRTGIRGSLKPGPASRSDGAPGRRSSQELLPDVYDQLRRLAAQQMATERAGHTLTATALVHEAWLRVEAGGGDRQWDSPGHFYSAAAEAMRRILVDSARRKARLKRGSDPERLDLVESRIAAPTHGEDLLALDESLSRLETVDTQSAKIVKLRFFSGLTVPQIAEHLELSPRSVDRLWAYAKAWLRRDIGHHSRPDQNAGPPLRAGIETRIHDDG